MYVSIVRPLVQRLDMWFQPLNTIHVVAFVAVGIMFFS
jgi:hypothetical protein